MKNIAISLLQISHQNPTGVFIYIENLLDNLFEIDKNNKYYLLLSLNNYRYFKKRYKNIEFKIIDIRHDLNPVRIFLKLITKIKKDKSLKEKILKKEIQKFVDKKNIDTFFFPSTFIYPKNIKNVKIIITICDLQHEYFPENFSKKHLKYRKENYQYAVLNSDHIIAISNYTKKTIVEKYKINPNKITTIHLGTGDKIKKDIISLPKNFIFYPAAFWPHKNHKILIRTLKEFPDLSLVFTGITIREKVKKEIDHLTKLYGLSKRVLFLDHISDEKLNYVYQKAKALVFPSSFEGFGLPLVEAFKRKLPIIAANNTSINEIVGDAGLLFKTNDLKMLTECIKKILTNHGLRKQLKKKGIERVKSFSWKNTAKKTLLILQNI